ncbi:MAG: hypothetical protein A2X57_06615, partial [Nitrospirae bacterium GWD2_57_8]
MALYPKDPKIANRESWFKLIIGAVLFGILAYKLFVIPINIPELKFSELLSLALALFAMGLSAAFYFKANDTSNQFYDNTYRFTQEMSEILGRIESGFGERLRHLDESYAGMLQKLPIDPAQVKKEIEAEELKVEKTEQEKEALISGVIDRARLVPDERDKIIADLKGKDHELEAAKQELKFLRQRLSDASMQVPFWNKPALHAIIRDIIKRHMEATPDMTARVMLDMDPNQLRFNFSKHILKDSFLLDLLNKHGVLMGRGLLNDLGLELARHILQKKVADEQSTFIS